ncbi:MAG: YveK family protein [Clostridia bacterium]
MNSFKNNDYIDLMDIAKKIWLYKLPVLAMAVLFMVLSLVRVTFFVDDQYVATGMLYVTNQKESIDQDDKAISQADINTAKSMSATYREILKTRTFLAEISEDIGGKYSWKQIKSMLSLSAVNNTELMQISVTAKNPEDAYLIADSIINNAPEKLSSIFKNGQIAIVDEAIPPTSPVGKGVTKQAMMGFVVGLALGLMIVVVIGLFDTKVHKSEDVSRRYNVSIIGEISQ